MLAAILATALAANGTPDWPQHINLEPGRGLLASHSSPGAPAPREALRVPRIALELLGGGAVAAVFGFGGIIAGAFFANSIFATTPTLIGGAIGASLGAFMGVLLSGLLLKGDGSIPWTIAGDLAGLAVALLTYSALGVVSFVVFPVLGAVVAFELSGASNAPSTADRRDPAATSLVAPVVARF